MHTDGTGTGTAPSTRVYSRLPASKKQPPGVGEHGSRRITHHRTSGFHLFQRGRRQSVGAGSTTRQRTPALVSRSPTVTGAKSLQKKAPSESVSRSEQAISNQVRSFHAEICDVVRSYDFEQARSVINNMAGALNLHWPGVKEFADRHHFSGGDTQKLLEISGINTSLELISKYHRPEAEKKLTPKDRTSADNWKLHLPARYKNLDWKDFSNAVIFVEYFMLNYKLHSDQSDAASIERLKAARRYLVWAQNSRALKQSLHHRWLTCYTKICSQLTWKDPGFAETPEGQQARRIVNLSQAVSSAGSPEEALDFLKQQHKVFIAEGITREAAETMCCGLQTLAEKWQDHEQYTEGERSIKKQRNTLYYGYELLLFGIKCHRDSIQGHDTRKLESTTGNIFHLGKLGISPMSRQKVFTDFITDAISEATHDTVQKPIRKQLSDSFAKNCGILLCREWQDALGAVNSGHPERAKKLEEELRFSFHEKPVIALLQGWRYLKEGRSQEAIKWLKKCPKFETYSHSHLEAARLYFAAGDSTTAKQMIREASGKVHAVQQIAYDLLLEQIEQTKSGKKRSALSSPEPGSQESKRRKTATRPVQAAVSEPVSATGSIEVEKQPGTVGVHVDITATDDTTTKEFQQRSKEHQDLKRDNEKLKLELNAKKAELEKAESDYSELENNYIQQFDELTNAYSLLQSSRDGLEAEVKKLQQDLQDVKSSSETVYIGQINAARGLNKDNNLLRKKLQDAESRNKQSRESISELESSLGEKEEELARLNADLLRSKNEIALYKRSLAKASETETASSVEAQQDKSSKLKNKILKLKQEKQQQKEQLEVKEKDLQKALDLSTQIISKKNDRISQLTSTHDQLVEGCEAKFSDIEKRAEKIVSESQRLTEKFTDFKTEVENLKRGITTGEFDEGLLQVIVYLEEQLKESEQQRISQSSQLQSDLQMAWQELAQVKQRLNQLSQQMGQNFPSIENLDSLSGVFNLPSTSMTFPQPDQASSSADEEQIQRIREFLEAEGDDLP